ncbi:uncharacterized protein LOC133723204 [Rosa rugosa]|uniref:uncharacterized protein LOC133723204 n=1 Tax=Rosa rugosa TaxID=74645 RepID=UPI002B404AA1|nr:uncharacterized protein LOC133723204 [Rosa rugosa]
MCDASDYAVGAMLGHHVGKIPHVIYYASRTINDAQLNYSITEKEFLTVVFALKRFHSYLIGTKVTSLGPRNQMPQTPILSIELFDIWGIDFIGPFPSSYGNLYILLAIDYVLKWVESKATHTNDSKVVSDFLKSNIFSRFRTPKAIISNGSHFCNRTFEALLRKYNITHKVGTPYHPQTSGQAELAYGKPCHLPMELEHRAWWAIKQFNMNIDVAGVHRKLQLNELEEINNDSYKSSRVYKEKTKAFHDHMISRKDFSVGHKVLLFNSCLKLFPGKLRFRWYEPFLVTTVYSHGAVEVQNLKTNNKFKVNGHRLKPYYEMFLEHNVEKVSLSEPAPSE